ncbi:MAG: methionyl-tRNA formyltransferase [Patescibacteria group bacterium]
MNKLKIAYFGSPDFAADFLEKLITDTTINQLIEVKLVVTQPDQKVGRKQILTPTPVKVVALKHSLEILEIENLKFNENCKLKIKNSDLCLVYAFGDLIPKELLSLPKYGFWNIHPSLLPKYRGPSPIAAPLINGDKTTGITIIKMDEEIDHGPIIAQESYTIKDSDYRPDLEKKLTELGFDLFKKTVVRLTGLRVNGLKVKEQNHKEAIYTNKLSKQDGFISFENLKLKIESSPGKLYNLFQGLYPWPGIWTVLPNGKRLKIIELKMKSEKLIIEKVQLESKKEVDFETFNKAYKTF